MKDNLGHDTTANVATMAKSQLNPSIMSHEHIQSQGHYKPNVRKADTLQTVVVSKSRDYKVLSSQKVDTTKFCSLKKQTLQSIVMKKSDTTEFSM